LFFFGGVVLGFAGIGHHRIVVIIAPFCKVIREFEARGVGGSVFEVDYNELFVGVGREEKRGFA
jgi:hypothetical protein